MAKKHPGHAEALWQWLFGAERPRRRLFIRNIRLSGPALARVSALSPSELAAFAALLLRLDADPISNSEMLTVKPPVPGLRWTSFLGHTVVFTLDPSQDSIRIASVR